MSKRINDVAHTTVTRLQRGRVIPHDPSAGTLEIFDAGLLLDNFNSRAGSDFLYSDGSTTNRRIEHQLGGVGAVAGSDLTYVSEPFVVPTSNPSADAFIFIISGANTAITSSQTNSLLGRFATNGDLVIDERGATGGDFRRFSYAGFRAAYSGKALRLIVAFTGGSTTSPVVFLDGLDVSASFAASTGGTPPNWVDASLSTSYFVQGYNWPIGRFIPGRFINRKYAQADVDYVQVFGRLPYLDAAGGSMVPVYSSDFSAGVDNWVAASGCTVAGNIDSIGGQDDNLKAYPDNTNGSHTFRTPGFAAFARTSRITFSYYIPSANTNVKGFSLRQYNNIVIQNFTAPTYDAWTTATVEWTDLGNFGSGPNPLYFYFLNGAGSASFTGAGSASDDLIYIRGVSGRTLAALTDPVIQPCRVLDDATNNNRAGLLVGFSPVTSKKDWRIPVFVDTSTTGNKQLLGGAVFSDPTSQTIDTIEVNNGTASATTSSVGDGTTATRYTASTAAGAGRKRIAVTNDGYPADSGKTGIYENVTVASGFTAGTTELRIIRGHRT